MLLLMLVFGYSVFRINDLVKRKNPVISKGSFMRNLNLEGAYQPSNFGFDISFGLGKYLDPKIGYYSVNQINYFYTQEGARKKIRTPLSFSICGDSKFGNKNLTTTFQYGINNQFCIDNNNFTLEGEFYSDNFQYIEIKLFKCINSTTSNDNHCAPQEQVDSFFDSSTLNFAFIN